MSINNIIDIMSINNIIDIMSINNIMSIMYYAKYIQSIGVTLMLIRLVMISQMWSIKVIMIMIMPSLS